MPTLASSVLYGPRTAGRAAPPLAAAIAGRCRDRPDLLAVSHGDLRLSYGQLDLRAARVRDALRRAGVGPGQLVPIITRGGPGMIAAMLGIWAAGAAFAPLAATGPAARRDLALGRIRTRLALTDGPEDAVAGWDCLAIDAIVEAPTDAVPLAASGAGSGDALAYGFFTSGSTGTPKCCLNIHSGLANRAAAMSRRFALAAGEAVMQNSAHTFDSSLWQIFWPLSVGAEVAIPERDGILDLDATLEQIEARQVRMTDFVPSILEQLVQRLARSAAARRRMRSLRTLLVGGEALSLHLVRELTRALPDLRVVNTYGPTEASIGMVFHEFTGGEPRVPLGLPIDNTALAVVDEALRPVPVGEIGEVVIGGACMGLGYLGDAERTAEAFVRDSGLSLGSEVVYRTGDMGHVGEDGLLYFDGRADNQVKIAGVRIEIDEIEHHMHDLDGVERAKVVLVKDEGRSWLAGFYVASRAVPDREMHAHLARRLDKGGVPALLVQVDDFPKTPSGKTDGRALIADYRARADAAAEGAPAADGHIGALLGMARRLLPGRAFTAEDDLVALGLDSLAGLSLLLEAERLTGRWVGPSAFFARPCLATLVEPAAAFEPSGGPASIARDVAELSRPRFAPARSRPGGEAVLLTGATGYVGRALLAALLARGAGRIVCLVRAADDDAAAARLAGLVPNLPGARVRALAADLSSAGDPRPAWIDRLPDDVGAVVHAAAEVNFSKSYGQLRDANVAATALMCALASARGARLHQVSSAAVLGLARPALGAPPDAPAGDASADGGSGYASSKWAAEQVIAAFRARGLAAEVYRLGEMMPDRAYDRINPLATFTLLCRAARRVGSLPDLDERTDYTPTGHVAAWMADRCLDPEPLGGDSALVVHPARYGLVELLRLALGPLPIVPLGAFRARLSGAVRDTGDPHLARALLLLPTDDDVAKGRRLFGTSAAGAAAAPPRGLSWPDLSDAALASLLAPFGADDGRSAG